jgi:hypothetical protein
MNVRDMIKRDFGIDLPIICGTGNSREEPFVVNAKTVDEAFDVMVTLIRLIGIGGGRYWRSLSCTRIEHMFSELFQYKIEVEEFSHGEVVSINRNHYFEFPEMAAGTAGLLPTIRAISTASGLWIPEEIGWLHAYGQPINNEKVSPGLGQTFAYGTVDTKATLYTYDRKLDVIDPDVFSLTMQNEFHDATNNIVQVYPTAQAWGNSFDLRDILISGFIIGDDYTLLCLGSARNKFLKLRITFPKNSEYFELYHYCIQEFENLVKSNRSTDRSV